MCLGVAQAVPVEAKVADAWAHAAWLIAEQRQHPRLQVLAISLGRALMRDVNLLSLGTCGPRAGQGHRAPLRAQPLMVAPFCDQHR